MKIDMQCGRLVIELPGESAELLVNGELQGQYFLGAAEGPEQFRDRLRKANAAHAACGILRSVLGGLEKPKNSGTGKAERERRASFAEGLMAGLRGEYRRLYSKGSGVGNAVQEPELPQGADYAAFRSGWETGQGVFAALAIADGRPDPRADW